MPGKRRGGSGKGMIGSIFAFILAGGLIFAFISVNNLKSIDDVYRYGKAYSDYVSGCMGGKPEWNCDSYWPSDKRGVTEGNSKNSGKTSEDSKNSGTSGNSKNSSNDGNDPSSKDKYAQSLNKLNSIPVKDSVKSNYNRADWNHWIGSRCDNTREQVLKSSGKNIKLDSSNCKVVSGVWVDPYGGSTIEVPRNIDIDHVVPLSYADRNGGSSWDAKKKEKFANDKRFLLATSAKENRSKGDKGPSDYMPPNKKFTCEYSSLFVESASEYGLSLPKKDSEILKKNLKSCV